MILRRTQSLCPVCLRRVEAAYERSAGDFRGVALRKVCPEHGSFSVPIWHERSDGSDFESAPLFESWSRPKSPSHPVQPGTNVERGCPFDWRALPPACPAYLHRAGGSDHALRYVLPGLLCRGGRRQSRDRHTGFDGPPLSVVAAQLDSLRAASGPCNVQISGGEPTVREDLPAIVALARERGFGLVQLNTNGLRLGGEAAYAAQLRDAGLDSVYLQWDGVSEVVFQTLRGRPCLDLKRRAVEHCAAAGLGVVFVATLARGVNDGEIGDLLRLALALGPAVRGLHFQPAASFGRYPWSLEKAPRADLA